MKQDDFTEKLIEDQLVIGRVITQASTLEGMINAYIAEFYTHCSASDYRNLYVIFIQDVLDNKFISLNTKIDILFKIFRRIDRNRLNRGDRKLFEEWLRIRNIFAHGKQIGKEGGSEILFGGTFFDIQNLAKESASLQLKLQVFLERYSELRGQYFNLVPINEARVEGSDG